jgi:hypothetical protein
MVAGSVMIRLTSLPWTRPSALASAKLASNCLTTAAAYALEVGRYEKPTLAGRPSAFLSCQALANTSSP